MVNKWGEQGGRWSTGVLEIIVGQVDTACACPGGWGGYWPMLPWGWAGQQEGILSLTFAIEEDRSTPGEGGPAEAAGGGPISRPSIYSPISGHSSHAAAMSDGVPCADGDAAIWRNPFSGAGPLSPNGSGKTASGTSG